MSYSGMQPSVSYAAPPLPPPPAFVGGSVSIPQNPSVVVGSVAPLGTFPGSVAVARAGAAPVNTMGVAVPTTEQGIVGSLTKGIPDPRSIMEQKENYAKALEVQLKHGAEILAQQHKQKTDQLHAAANVNKHQYHLQVDQQVKAQELGLNQRYNEQLMLLQQAAQAQRTELEQQACNMMLEYQQRKTAEEFAQQEVGIKKQHYEAQTKIAREMQKLGIHHNEPTIVTSKPNSVTPVVGAPTTGAPAITTTYAPPPMATYAAPPGSVSAPTAALPYVPPGAIAVPMPGSYVPPVMAGSYVGPPGPVVSKGSYVPPIF